MIEIKPEIEKHNLGYVKDHFSSGNDVNAQFDNGETVLIMACEFQNLDMVKYLISLGANPEIRECNGLDAEGIARFYGEGPYGHYSETCKSIVKELRSATNT